MKERGPEGQRGVVQPGDWDAAIQAIDRAVAAAQRAVEAAKRAVEAAEKVERGHSL